MENDEVEPHLYEGITKRSKALIGTIIVKFKLSAHHEQNTVLSNLHVLVQ